MGAGRILNLISYSLVLLAAFTRYAHAADILPLQHGFYVAIEVPCEQASNAALETYDGHTIGSAHLSDCKVDKLVHTGKNYTITQTCDQSYGGQLTFTFVYTIMSKTEYTSKDIDDDRVFHFRWCEASKLPEPWRNHGEWK